MKKLDIDFILPRSTMKQTGIRDFLEMKYDGKKLDFSLDGKALKDIKAELLIIGFYSDWLYPPERGKEIQIAAINNNIKSSYVVLDGEHGHDSFLFYKEQYSRIIEKFNIALHLYFDT